MLKSVHIQCFSGPYFPALGLDVEIYFRYPLKTPENQRFSDVFMGYRKQFFVFSPNVEKYEPEKTPNTDTVPSVDLSN